MTQKPWSLKIIGASIIAITIFFFVYFLIIYTFFARDIPLLVVYSSINFAELITVYSLIMLLPVIIYFTLKEYFLAVEERRKSRIIISMYVGGLISLISSSALIVDVLNGCSAQFCGYAILYAPVILVVGIIISLIIGGIFLSLSKKRLATQSQSS